MNRVETLLGPTILAIPENEPERLFTSPENWVEEYKLLAKKWHPDKSGGDAKVFSHIAILRSRAKEHIAAKIWREPDVLKFTSGEKSFRLSYKKEFSFELGKGYISKSYITYVFEKEYADLAIAATTAIKNLKYADAKMQEVIGRDMPRIHDYKEANDGSHILILNKPQDLVRLRDMQIHLGGKIPAPHAAWIISRLLSHMVYFEWCGITHNDLSVDNIFIHPAGHTASIFGGWWYSLPIGEKHIFLPSRTLEVAPPSLKTNKIATIRTDSELVRLVARELFGPNLAKDFPAISKWALSHQSARALANLKYWQETVLPDAFGPKKFVKWEVSAREVYNY